MTVGRLRFHTMGAFTVTFAIVLETCGTTEGGR